jgi:hypothetical protein
VALATCLRASAPDHCVLGVSLPRNGARSSVPSESNTATVRPSVKTVICSSISAPSSNSSGGMKRCEPNIRPISFATGPRW